MLLAPRVTGHLQLVQYPGEVLGLALGLWVVGDVVPQRVDDLRLQTLHLLWLQETVALCRVRVILVTTVLL